MIRKVPEAIGDEVLDINLDQHRRAISRNTQFANGNSHMKGLLRTTLQGVFFLNRVYSRCSTSHIDLTVPQMGGTFLC